ncbi:MAG TPA: hypothetical protein VFC73_07470 [Syntrophomonadaceae bacterium]|nr:hypothetical protein [Syntrophomonadaceae bacterium]
MPKLAKIRLTGCQYEGLTKEHENSIFDLTKDGQADHTLFTLMNGGGKGVMMQLIFQLLLPETKWGKNNGNKVISMFYDKRNNLHPFTFHVVLEWILDTIPEKRLITGIAVKAILKNIGNEEEKTGLSYFLYTHEHENEGFFSVENLPLYDESTSSAVDADILEDFIDEYKQYFTKYSQSSVRRKDGPYYTYLESRGIYRSEWINLKKMNKSEGGVGEFFSGASDNKSIFDEIIIPVISENIRSNTYEEENSLIEMFKSNISITKDLPVLIKREGDYKGLLEEIKPLIENADSGSRFWDMRERCIDEGNDIYFILKEEETRVTQETEKWGQEVKKTENERKDLAFKKDNLNYNKEKMALDAEIEKSLKLEGIIIDKSREIEEKQAEKKLYKINEMLFEKKKTEEQITRKNEEKQRLIEVLDIADIQLKAAQLDDEIELEWQQIQSYWQSQEEQYYGYINYLSQEMKNNNKLKKKHESRVKALQNELIKFEIKEDELAKQRIKLGEAAYDPLSLFYPERILEDLIKEKIELEEKNADLSKQIIAYREQESSLGLEINQLEYRHEEKLGNVNSLEQKVAEQEKNELILARKVTKQLLENYEGTLLNHDWFAGKLESIEELDKFKKKNLEEAQKTIWEKSIDQLLNQEDYFIPNKDVVLIKQEIIRLGIYVETGSEYLQNLDDGEKDNILRQHPGFLYSVVIKSDRDWETIDKNIKSDLFLNNMVPIYIRSAMESEENGTFKSITGKAIELVNNNAYIMWKENIENNLAALSQVESDIKDDLQDIEDLKGELRLIAKTDTAAVLNQKLKEEKHEIIQLADEIRSKKEEKLAIKNLLNQAEVDLKASNDQLMQINDDIKQIEVYIERLSEVEQDRINIEKVKKEQKQFEQDISLIEDNIENLIKDQNIIDKSYLEWKVNIKNIVQKVKEVFAKAIYSATVQDNYLNKNIPNLIVVADKLLGLVHTRKALEADIASKNSSIAVVDTEIKNLKEKAETHINQLGKISADWLEYPYLELPIDEIQIRIDKFTKMIQKLQEENDNTKSAYDRTMGGISSKKEQLGNIEVQILKEHQKPVVVIEFEDINSEIDLVERDIQSNQRYADLCIKTFQANKDKEIKLEINISKIKNSYSLNVNQGKMDELIKERIQQTPDLVVDEWLRKYTKSLEDINKTQNEGEIYRSRFIKKIEFSLEEDRLRQKIITTIKEAQISNFKSNLISFKSMENHFQQELNRLTRDKEKAEEVMQQWTHRASIHVLRMVEALKDMVASMNYINEQGYAFPLVKLKGTERLPQEEIDITYLLNEYFVQAISKVIESKQDIFNLAEYELKELMGDKTIFSKALQGRYPTLLVYKMSENNEFRYARARDEYYTTWEAINKGEGYLPEGSGGQTLSVNTFVIMMLMSFKKKHIGNENPSTVLILDNPFGQASTKHVLDPIFEIADKLNFQLICFAAPEIIKVEISERFPIFWELKIEKGKIIHGGRVIKVSDNFEN